jgi:class 3 adenylate cyclase
VPLPSEAKRKRSRAWTDLCARKHFRAGAGAAILTSMSEPIEIDQESFRIDFETRITGSAAEGSLEFEMRPHPDRYEWREDEEYGRILVDRKTNFMYPESVVEEVAAQMKGAAIYGPPARVPAIEVLLRERREAIEAALGGEDPEEELADPAGEELAARVGEDQQVSVLAADLVDSTRLQAGDRRTYDTVVPILLNEISAIGSRLGGTLINYGGDGGLVGFLGPGFNVASDLAFDAATALVASIYGVMNPLLKAASFPGVDVRVGLDANNARVTPIGSASARRQPDLLGIAVSMAAKVQARGRGGEVWVGQSLYETLHISRQELLEAAPTPADWDFVDRSGDPYALYRYPLVPPLPSAQG